MSLHDGRTPALAEGDTVTEEHLARLLGEGIHPVTGEKLGKRFPSLQPPRERIAARVVRLDPGLRGEARAEAVERIREEEVAKKSRTAVAEFDLTFSPPKSVSAIWGVADAGTKALIAQAHHAAMRDTIALLEERVAATRVGTGGIAQMPIVGVIATAFDHYDSRAVDPQLYTHVVVPAKYVREELEPGYASTVHRAQGASVDTAHTLVAPETSSRELFYVAMTRGKHRNHAYVIVPDPHEVEPHLDQPKPLTLTERLAKVLARSDADLSATETLMLEVDRHASLSTLLAEQQALIEIAARGLLHDAQEAGAAWVARLGQPSSRLEARARWEAHAATVALYRYRYEITGPSPLGDSKAVLTADQAAEYRAAQVALRGVQTANRDHGQVQDRVTRRPDPRLRL